MQIIRKGDLRHSDRRFRTAAYDTTRFLLASDGAGAPVTDIVLTPGIGETYDYVGRTEIASCLKGEAMLTDLAAGERHAVGPGTMWVAGPGERFRFRTMQPTRLVCVFVPSFEGGETGFAADIGFEDSDLDARNSAISGQGVSPP